jgi:hypothetical protein
VPGTLRKVRLYQETLFVGDTVRYVKEGSGNGHLHRGPSREPGRRGSLSGEFERRTNEGSGGASISKGALREEPGRRTPLLGTLKDM